MIRIHAELDASGCIRVLKSEGHAAKSGSVSLPCAVVSVILKTYGQLLLDCSGVGIKGDIPAPGLFSMQVLFVPEGLVDWYRGVSGFVVGALGDLVADCPGEVQLIFTHI